MGPAWPGESKVNDLEGGSMRKIGTVAALVATAAFVVTAVGLTAPSNSDELLKGSSNVCNSPRRRTRVARRPRRCATWPSSAKRTGRKGLNADVWAHEGYAYIGHWGFSDWSSGSKTRFCPSPPRNGVAVVDATDLSDPVQVARVSVNSDRHVGRGRHGLRGQVRAACRARHRRGGHPGVRRFAAGRELPRGSCSSTSRTRRARRSSAS